MSTSTRRLNRRVSKLAASAPASWFFLHVANPVDKRLLPATNGRISLALGQPVLCLEVTGAKSGKRRRTPLLYMEHGDDLVMIASATGRTQHPAWYRNLTANPRVKVYAPRGRTGEYIARTAEGDEREELYRRAVDFYPGFTVYETRTSRQFPVVVLSRAR
ncbi:MAG TPA: nitroreductase family deazaflavin-dependent oxidoreductase [Solirubrobacteraceae bacterium]